MSSVESITTANDVDALVERLYGADLAAWHPRILHVTSAWRRGGELVTIRINERSPRSELDFFVLNLCRARADAIVTTGKVLRDEPSMHHGLQGPAGVPGALAAWRRERLGKETPPVSLVLTSGRDLDLGHPLFRRAARSVVFTTAAGERRLGGRARDAGVEVVASAEPGLGAAALLLERRYDASTVSVEAGPTTARELYGSPAGVDELLLSVYAAAELDAAVQGRVFLAEEALEDVLEMAGTPFEDGRWSFRRYLRRGEGV